MPAAAAVVKKDLLTLLRTWKAALALLAMVMAGAAFSLFLPSTVLLQQTGSIAKEFFGLAVITLFAGTSVFVPGVAAASIATEREADMLEQVRLSLVGRGGFVSAKFASAMALMMLLTIGMLPVAASVMFLAGIDARQLLSVFATLAISAASSAAAGLVCACLFRSFFLAALVSYVFVFFFHGYFALILPAVAEVQTIRWLCRLTIPVTVAGQVFTEYLPLPGVRHPYLSLAPHVVFIAAAFPWCARLLDRTTRQVHRVNEAVIDDPGLLERRRRTWPYYLLDPLKRPRPIEDNANALAVKEFRWGFLGRETNMVRTFYITAIVGTIISLFLVALEADVYPYMLFLMCLYVVLVPALLANTFTKEREQANLDMLRLSLVVPRDIVRGKMYAGLLRMAPFTAAVFLSTIPLIYAGPRTVLLGYPALALSAATAIGATLLASTAAKSTTRALVLSYILVSLFMLAVPIGLFLLVPAVSVFAEDSYWGVYSYYEYRDAFRHAIDVVRQGGDGYWPLLLSPLTSYGLCVNRHLISPFVLCSGFAFQALLASWLYRLVAWRFTRQSELGE